MPPPGRRLSLAAALSVAFFAASGCKGEPPGALTAATTSAPAAGGASSIAYDWDSDCGVTAYKHAPHNPSLAKDPSYVADEYLGLAVDRANAKASQAGLVVRVLGVDGRCAGRTDESRSDRVNFYVEDGVVRAAARY